MHCAGFYATQAQGVNAFIHAAFAALRHQHPSWQKTQSAFSLEIRDLPPICAAAIHVCGSRRNGDATAGFLRLDQTDGVIRMGRMVTKKQSEFVLEAERAKVRPPRLFKVLLLNDDFTPMDFVVVVLQKFFAMDRERATRVMLQVHREGSGVCGVFPKDIAATKVEQVSAFARQHQHPLACVMEEN